MLEQARSGQLERLCSTLAILIRVTPGRADLPADGRAVCPGIGKRTSAALVKR